MDRDAIAQHAILLALSPNILTYGPILNLGHRLQAAAVAIETGPSPIGVPILALRGRIQYTSPIRSSPSECPNDLVPKYVLPRRISNSDFLRQILDGKRLVPTFRKLVEADPRVSVASREHFDGLVHQAIDKRAIYSLRFGDTSGGPCRLFFSIATLSSGRNRPLPISGQFNDTSDSGITGRPSHACWKLLEAISIPEQDL